MAENTTKKKYDSAGNDKPNGVFAANFEFHTETRVRKTAVFNSYFLKNFVNFIEFCNKFTGNCIFPNSTETGYH